MRIRALTLLMVSLFVLSGCIPQGFLLPDDEGEGQPSTRPSLSYECNNCDSIRQGVAPLEVTFHVNDVDVETDDVAVLWRIQELTTGETDTAFTPLEEPFNYTFPRKGLWQVQARIKEADVSFEPIEFRVNENAQTATVGTGWKEGPKGWCSFALRFQTDLSELEPPYPKEADFVSLVKVHEAGLEAVRVQLDIPYATEASPDYDLLQPTKSPTAKQMHNTILFGMKEPNEQRWHINVRCIKPNGLMDQIEFDWIL